jgi:hypothetical protein
MASSSNPYEHYNEPQVDDDDLIDPDDGTCPSHLPTSLLEFYRLIDLDNMLTSASQPRRPRRPPPAPTIDFLPRPLNGQHWQQLQFVPDLSHPR